MKTQIIKPKDGSSYIIPNYDGEFLLILDLEKPLKNITFQFPENPPRASKVRIHATQDIQKIKAIGNFNQPFRNLKAGNIDFVSCPIGNEYLVTGTNENYKIPKKKTKKLLIAQIIFGIFQILVMFVFIYFYMMKK